MSVVPIILREDVMEACSYNEGDHHTCVQRLGMAGFDPWTVLRAIMM